MSFLFVNLTPHAVRVVKEGISLLALLPGRQVARCETSTYSDGTLNGIEIKKECMGEVTGLPEPEEGIFYVVSRVVAKHPSCAERNDLLVPGDLVRDEDGVIVGCSCFLTFSEDL